jgi:cyanophycinase-like exopeptidase
MATHKQTHLLRYLLEQKIQVIDQAARQKLRHTEIMAILAECTAVFDTDSEQAQGQVLTLPVDIERTVQDELRMACAWMHGTH